VTASSSLPTLVAVGLSRGLFLFLLWLLLLPSTKPADLLFGLAVTIAVTVLSLKLYGPIHGRLHLGGMAALMPHFIWQSILGGVDVARRAFDPEMPMAPGFVACPLDFPEGLARNTFAVVTSLMPGTVPCGEENGVLIYHCIDIRQPVVEQLWAEEKLLARAITAGRKHD
jgi:multicomponent Na+:H+ antiporter subunit E